MTDLSLTIEPKSDQLNADSLLLGPRTITVTAVARNKEPTQPIAISFDGDGGKPYLPGKSMRRVLVQVWGADGAGYVGRRMTIYRDPTVRFGDAAVGGIRISHMSHMREPVTLALTASKSVRKPFTVRPLADAPAAPAAPTPPDPPANDKLVAGVAALVARIAAADRLATLQAITAAADVTKQRAWLSANRADLAAEVDDAVRAALDRLDPPTDDAAP